MLTEESAQRQESRRSGRLADSSIALTSEDIAVSKEEDAKENHRRSQSALAEVLARRGITTDTQAPFLGEGGDDVDLRRLEVVKQIVDELKLHKGIHGLRTLRVLLHSTDLHCDGISAFPNLMGQLGYVDVRRNKLDTLELSELFNCGEEDHVDYILMLAHAYRNWSPRREAFVREAFETLSRKCSGGILTAAIMQTEFKPAALTTVHVPDLHDKSFQEFFHQWSNGVLNADGTVIWLDFVDYYLDVSALMDSEQEFCDYVCRSWSIDMDDMLARKVFFSYSTSEQGLLLPAHDFTKMLMDMDSTITGAEALAWYEAINVSDTGEVSLQEFLSSKVLKVKRLFEDFGLGSRSLTYDQMYAMLRSLSRGLTDDEMYIMCRYADVDDNRSVDFRAFLRQNLLKVLQIFDEFNSDGDKILSEPELKALLRKMDPYMEDSEVAQIYKAIDVDNSGEISFQEFLESQILQAKTLFDRYDPDRTKSLTQFKFRELLLDLDKTLTPAELEALHRLAADPSTDRVTFSGFLSPNVVKLKRLFDKYDKDRSKLLDIDECREMLQEMFHDVSESNLQILLETALPSAGAQEISLTAYVHNFKAIQWKYDCLMRAEVREAKKWSASRGLVFNPQSPKCGRSTAPTSPAAARAPGVTSPRALAFPVA